MGVLFALLLRRYRLHRAQARLQEFRRLPVIWTSRGLEARERVDSGGER
jgi:hypothetical protein